MLNKWKRMSTEAKVEGMISNIFTSRRRSNKWYNK